MNVTLELNDVDTPAVEAFAQATGWRANLGIRPEDWMRQRVIDYINNSVASGMAMVATDALRSQMLTAQQAYSDALTRARQSAVLSGAGTPIPQPILPKP